MMKRKILITFFCLVTLSFLFPKFIYAACDWNICDQGKYQDQTPCNPTRPPHGYECCYETRGLGVCRWYTYQKGKRPTPTPGGPGATFDPCKDDPKSTECYQCIGNGNIWTALGCIPTDPAAFVAWVLARAISIGGGIAFLLMIGGGFTIMTSSGNPEQLNKGKSIITSAATGLLFIIFSVLLLKIIGIDILKLPGFNQ